MSIRPSRGLIVLDSPDEDAEGVLERDFTEFDEYIDDIGLHVYEAEGTSEQIQPTPIRPPRQDFGFNPDEARREVGDYTVFSDFSHGQDQRYYHREGKDPRKYLYGEGVDIAEPGCVYHARDVVQGGTVTTPTALWQARDYLFVADGALIRRTTDLSSYTTEFTGPASCLSGDSSGDESYAAFGASGVYKGSSGGAWAAFQPDGATNLSVGTATIVRWLKGRLFVVGQGGRALYEVVTSSTPSYMVLLPAGWTFTDVFEAGSYVYACAVNRSKGLSALYHFGLNSGLTAFEHKGSSDFSTGVIIYSGKGQFGRIYVGGGIKDEAGLSPVAYQCVADASGFVYVEQTIAEGKGDGVLDLPVRSVEPDVKSMLIGWTLGSDNPYGTREGVSRYFPARESFSQTLSIESTPATVQPVLDISVYKGRIVYITADGLYLEDIDHYRDEMVLIPSIADNGDATQKNHSQLEIRLCEPLPAGTSVVLFYSTKNPEENDWHLAGVLSTTNAMAKTIDLLPGIDADQLVLKAVSHANSDGTEAPQIATLSLLSDPNPASPQWDIIQTYVLAGEKRKDELSMTHYDPDPNATLLRLKDKLHSKVRYYRQEARYLAYVADMVLKKPGQPQYVGTEGESAANLFILQVKMRGIELGSESGEMRVT